MEGEFHFHATLDSTSMAERDAESQAAAERDAAEDVASARLAVRDARRALREAKDDSAAYIAVCVEEVKRAEERLAAAECELQAVEAEG